MKTSLTRLAVQASIVSALLLTVLTASLAGAAPSSRHVTPTPDGFAKYLVYMANGLYNPNDPNYTPPDGMYFQKVIMQRTDAQISQQQADAIAFFQKRFGVDPNTPGVSFMSFIFNARNGYRAYTISGESVPSSGWVVRDGGWQLAVTDPNGITLGGEFAGTHVPMGAAVVFGDYNIQVLSPSGKQERPPILIHYQSGTPIVAGQFAMSFRCELSSPEFGHGLAQGIVANQVLPDGRVQANIRNVLTFTGLGTNGN